MNTFVMKFCLYAVLAALCVVFGLSHAEAQYVFTNAPDPSLVITNAQSAWSSVSILKISIVAFMIVLGIIKLIAGRR